MRRLILNGILGMTGCMVGALVAEVMLPRSAVAPGQSPVTAFSPVATRLQEAGAPTGEVQVALMTAQPSDVELSCGDPTGEVLDQQHRTIPSGGTFDPPAGDGGEAARGNVISLHWTARSAPQGRYQVFVGGANRVAGEHISYICCVKNGDDVQEFSGTVLSEEPRRLVYEFSFRRASWLDRLPGLRGGLWNALLAVGVTSGLLAGRCVVWRRLHPLLRPGLLALLGSGVVGLGAAVTIHWLWRWWGLPALARPLGLVTTWLVMGGLLGALSTLYIPTVRRRQAILGGALGGALAALAWASDAVLPDQSARFVASAALGVSLGVAVTLAEGTPLKAFPVPRPSPSPVAGLSLRFPSGRAIPLAEGVCLSRDDIPGLAPRLLRRTIARVVPNPKIPAVLGLMNLSRRSWSVSFPDGSQAAVAPGRSVRLLSGVRIDFGPLWVEVH
jgi:hypothetical protein